MLDIKGFLTDLGIDLSDDEQLFGDRFKLADASKLAKIEYILGQWFSRLELGPEDAERGQSAWLSFQLLNNEDPIGFEPFLDFLAEPQDKQAPYSSDTEELVASIRDKLHLDRNDTLFSKDPGGRCYGLVAYNWPEVLPEAFPDVLPADFPEGLPEALLGRVRQIGRADYDTMAARIHDLGQLPIPATGLREITQDTFDWRIIHGYAMLRKMCLEETDFLELEACFLEPIITALTKAPADYDQVSLIIANAKAQQAEAEAEAEAKEEFARSPLCAALRLPESAYNHPLKRRIIVALHRHFNDVDGDDSEDTSDFELAFNPDGAYREALDVLLDNGINTENLQGLAEHDARCLYAYFDVRSECPEMPTIDLRNETLLSLLKPHNIGILGHAAANLIAEWDKALAGRLFTLVQDRYEAEAEAEGEGEGALEEAKVDLAEAEAAPVALSFDIDQVFILLDYAPKVANLQQYLWVATQLELTDANVMLGLLCACYRKANGNAIPLFIHLSEKQREIVLTKNYLTEEEQWLHRAQSEIVTVSRPDEIKDAESASHEDKLLAQQFVDLAPAKRWSDFVTALERFATRLNLEFDEETGEWQAQWPRFILESHVEAFNEAWVLLHDAEKSKEERLEYCYSYFTQRRMQHLYEGLIGLDALIYNNSLGELLTTYLINPNDDYHDLIKDAFRPKIFFLWARLITLSDRRDACIAEGKKTDFWKPKYHHDILALSKDVVKQEGTITALIQNDAFFAIYGDSGPDAPTLLSQQVLSDQPLRALAQRVLVASEANPAFSLKIIQRVLKIRDGKPPIVGYKDMNREVASTLLAHSGDLKSINALRRSWHIAPIIPPELTFAGTDPTEKMTASADTLYQWTEREMGLAEVAILRTAQARLANTVSGELPVLPLLTEEALPALPADAGCSWFLLPILGNSVFVNEGRDASFVSAIRPVINAYRADREGPRVFCGVLNTNGNHYISYFILKKSDNTLQVRFVDPSAKLYVNEAVDGKAKLAISVKALFESNFDCTDCEPVDIALQLKQRDCGANSLQVVFDAIRTAGSESPILTLEASGMVFHQDAMHHAYVPKLSVYHEREGKFLYARTLNEASREVRQKWADYFKRLNHVYTLAAFEGLTADVTCIDTFEEYDYAAAAEAQYKGDLVQAGSSEILAIIMTGDNLGRLRHYYRANGILPDKAKVDELLSHPAWPGFGLDDEEATAQHYNEILPVILSAQLTDEDYVAFLRNAFAEFVRIYRAEEAERFSLEDKPESLLSEFQQDSRVQDVLGKITATALTDLQSHFLPQLGSRIEEGTRSFYEKLFKEKLLTVLVNFMNEPPMLDLATITARAEDGVDTAAVEDAGAKEAEQVADEDGEGAASAHAEMVAAEETGLKEKEAEERGDDDIAPEHLATLQKIVDLETELLDKEKASATFENNIQDIKAQIAAMEEPVGAEEHEREAIHADLVAKQSALEIAKTDYAEARQACDAVIIQLLIANIQAGLTDLNAEEKAVIVNALQSKDALKYLEPTYQAIIDANVRRAVDIWLQNEGYLIACFDESGRYLAMPEGMAVTLWPEDDYDILLARNALRERPFLTKGFGSKGGVSSWVNTIRYTEADSRSRLKAAAMLPTACRHYSPPAELYNVEDEGVITKDVLNFLLAQKDNPIFQACFLDQFGLEPEVEAGDIEPTPAMCLTKIGQILLTKIIAEWRLHRTSDAVELAGFREQLACVTEGIARLRDDMPALTLTERLTHTPQTRLRDFFTTLAAVDIENTAFEAFALSKRPGEMRQRQRLAVDAIIQLLHHLLPFTVRSSSEIEGTAENKVLRFFRSKYLLGENLDTLTIPGEFNSRATSISLADLGYQSSPLVALSAIPITQVFTRLKAGAVMQATMRLVLSGAGAVTLSQVNSKLPAGTRITLRNTRVDEALDRVKLIQLRAELDKVWVDTAAARGLSPVFLSKHDRLEPLLGSYLTKHNIPYSIYDLQRLCAFVSGLDRVVNGLKEDKRIHRPYESEVIYYTIYSAQVAFHFEEVEPKRGTDEARYTSAIRQYQALQAALLAIISHYFLEDTPRAAAGLAKLCRHASEQGICIEGTMRHILKKHDLDDLETGLTKEDKLLGDIYKAYDDNERLKGTDADESARLEYFIEQIQARYPDGLPQCRNDEGKAGQLTLARLREFVVDECMTIADSTSGRVLIFAEVVKLYEAQLAGGSPKTLDGLLRFAREYFKGDVEWPVLVPVDGAGGASGGGEEEPSARMVKVTNLLGLYAREKCGYGAEGVREHAVAAASPAAAPGDPAPSAVPGE